MTDNLPAVTRENYFSPEINMAYMSATQYKKFERCPAAALAELRGEYTPPTSQAFLVGGYIDAYFAGESALYAAQHPEMFKRDGQLKAEFIHAQKVIARMEESDLYMRLMTGEKQVIRTGEIAGVPFKIKMDCLLNGDQAAKIAQHFPEADVALGFCDGAIVDQKVMKDLEGVWSEEDHEKVSFISAYGYDIQGAIYQAIEGHSLPFILAIGTKQDEPDLNVKCIRDDHLAAKLAEVEDNAPRYQAIKEGREKPRRCERCAYCRMTRKLDRIEMWPPDGTESEGNEWTPY